MSLLIFCVSKGRQEQGTWIFQNKINQMSMHTILNWKVNYLIFLLWHLRMYILFLRPIIFAPFATALLAPPLLQAWVG